MQVIGLTSDEQDSIFRILATILWLGNIDFVEGDDGNAAISDSGVADFAAYLLKLIRRNCKKCCWWELWRRKEAEGGVVFMRFLKT